MGQYNKHQDSLEHMELMKDLKNEQYNQIIKRWQKIHKLTKLN